MRFEATRSAKAIGFEGRGFEAFVLAGLTARQSSPPTLSDAPGDKQPGGAGITSEFELVPDEVHFIQIENLLSGADIEFKADIHNSFSIVSVELCVGTRLFANL